jgi:hypothetical protein
MHVKIVLHALKLGIADVCSADEGETVPVMISRLTAEQRSYLDLQD